MLKTDIDAKADEPIRPSISGAHVSAKVACRSSRKYERLPEVGWLLPGLRRSASVGTLQRFGSAADPGMSVATTRYLHSRKRSGHVDPPGGPWLIRRHRAFALNVAFITISCGHIHRNSDIVRGSKSRHFLSVENTSDQSSIEIIFLYPSSASSFEQHLNE